LVLDPQAHVRIAVRDFLRDADRFNARMAAISPQTPDESLSTAEKHALQFPVLSDAGARVARQLGVTFQPAEDVLEAQRALGVDIREGTAEGATELSMPTVVEASACSPLRKRGRAVGGAPMHRARPAAHGWLATSWPSHGRRFR
jgi:hypothetical protein